MSKSTLLKAAALISSISLVSIFLTYRAGVFETVNESVHHIHASPNGGTEVSIKKDTVPVDSARLRFLSSSKVLILRDRRIKPKSIIKRKKEVDSANKEKSYLWTSKSGRIFETVTPPKDSVKSKSDTIKTKGKQ